MFNKGDATKRNAFNITDEMIPALMTEDFGGGGTFIDHIRTHKDFKDKVPVGTKDVNKDGVIDLNDLTTEEMDLIVSEMGKEGNEDIARGYLAEWQAAQQETAYLEGNAGYVATQEAKRRKSLTAAERVAEDVDRRKALINEKK
jgi:hypothetical protein